MTRTAVTQRVTQTFAAAAVAAGFAIAAAPAVAQTYPSRPIHLIVNFPPGGTGDIVGRIIGNQLAIELNQSAVVENRSGAGGTIGARDVVNAAPDGYTLTVGQTPEIAINPYFMKDVGYDTLKDLQPIALAGVMPLAEATGLANFDFGLWAGFFAPHALPKDIAARLNAAINKIILEPDIKARLEQNGATVSALSIDQFSDFVRGEVTRYKAIIQEANLKPE